MPCQGLIFDLDDTLVHSQLAYQLASEAALHTAGLEDNADLALSRAEVKARLPHNHVAARNRWLYFKALLERTGRYSSTRLVAVVTAYEATLTQELRRQWRTLRRFELFTHLAARWPLAIVTNENLRTQVLKLEALGGAAEFFPVLVASEEFGVEKPHPRLLQEALRRLNLEPHNAVVIGDSVTDDMEPAAAMGCRCVLTTEFTSLPAPSAFPELRSLQELLTYDL